MNLATIDDVTAALADAEAMSRLARSPDREAVVLRVRRDVSAAASDALRRRLRRADREADIVRIHEPPPAGEIHDEAPDVRIPAGYRVARDGIWRQEDDGWLQLAPRPMLIERSLVADGAAHVEIGWLALTGAWHRAIVPRRIVCSARDLTGLADHGAPVASHAARSLVAYLQALEAMCDRHSAATTRCGWHGSAYQWGHQTIGGESRAMIAEGAVGGIADACHARGTWEGWLDVVRLVSDVPAAWLAMYAATASCVMRPCGLTQGAVVSFVGPRARGKTSVIRLAASVIGAPHEGLGIVRSWESTAYGIEQAAALSSEMGLILDETSRVRRSEDVAPIIYGLANGAGKQRGTESARSWRLMTLSTGEQPLSAYGGMEGASSRTIEVIEDQMMPSAAMAQAVEQGAGDHYGHALPRVVRAVQSMPAERIRAWYESRRDELQAEHPDQTRACRAVAALEVSARLLAHVGVPEPSCDVWGWLWRQMERHGRETDQASVAWARYEARRALEISRGWDRDVPVPCAIVRDWLDAAGMSGASMLREWASRGWVLLASDGRYARASIAGRQQRAVIPARQ